MVHGGFDCRLWVELEERLSTKWVFLEKGERVGCEERDEQMISNVFWVLKPEYIVFEKF